MDDKQTVENIVRGITASFFGKQSGAWKVLHEHTSMAADWDGVIDA